MFYLMLRNILKTLISPPAPTLILDNPYVCTSVQHVKALCSFMLYIVFLSNFSESSPWDVENYSVVLGILMLTFTSSLFVEQFFNPFTFSFLSYFHAFLSV